MAMASSRRRVVALKIKVEANAKQPDVLSISDLEALAALTIECGFQIHRDLGPGLVESVYEALLAASIAQAGLVVERQKSVDLEYRGIRLRDAFRADLLIDGRLVIEVKSVERLAAVHLSQVLTYLKLLDLPLGLLMNFGGGTFHEGLKRVANGYRAPRTPSAVDRGVAS